MCDSHSFVSNSLWPHGLYSPWTSPGQNTGVGSLSLLQEIFPTQGSNPGLPDCRWILYQLSHWGSLRIREWVIYLFSSRSSQPRNWTGVSWVAGKLYLKPFKIQFWASQVTLMVKNLSTNAGDIGDVGSISGLGRSPGEHGNPLQCSCLENPMDRGAWQATVHWVAKSQTRLKQLSMHTRRHIITLGTSFLVVLFLGQYQFDLCTHIFFFNLDPTWLFYKNYTMFSVIPFFLDYKLLNNLTGNNHIEINTPRPRLMGLTELLEARLSTLKVGRTPEIILLPSKEV